MWRPLPWRRFRDNRSDKGRRCLPPLILTSERRGRTPRFAAMRGTREKKTLIQNGVSRLGRYAGEVLRAVRLRVLPCGSVRRESFPCKTAFPRSWRLLYCGRAPGGLFGSFRCRRRALLKKQILNLEIGHDKIKISGEGSMLPIIHGIFVGILIILDVVLLTGKGSFLIAGYNAAPKAGQEKTDEQKSCR